MTGIAQQGILNLPAPVQKTTLQDLKICLSTKTSHHATLKSIEASYKGKAKDLLSGM